MEERHQQQMAAQPLSVACALCSWSVSGIAGEVIAAAREHREHEHGITRSRLRRATRHLGSFRQTDLSEDELEEIQAEIQRRRRLHGIEDAA